MIGGASLMGGHGTAFNALLGILILAVIGNIMNLKNVPGYHQEVVKVLLSCGRPAPVQSLDAAALNPCLKHSTIEKAYL